MKWSHDFLILGILFILIGVSLLAFTNDGSGNSVFFIFPFFFLSETEPVSIFIVLAFIFIIIVIMIRTSTTLLSQSHMGINDSLGEEFLPVGSMCKFCSAPVPANASFCPSCGNRVNQDNG